MPPLLYARAVSGTVLQWLWWLLVGHACVNPGFQKLVVDWPSVRQFDEHDMLVAWRELQIKTLSLLYSCSIAVDRTLRCAIDIDYYVAAKEARGPYAD